MGKRYLLDANAIIDYVGDKLTQVAALAMDKLIDDELPVNDAVADKAIDLRKMYRKLKLGDALIAATALVYDFTVVSRNTRDFQTITEQDCVNPHEFS